MLVYLLTVVTIIELADIAYVRVLGNPDCGLEVEKVSNLLFACATL